MAGSDDGYQNRRDNHYNQQRSSLRSDRSLRTPSRPQSSQLLERSFLSSGDDLTDTDPAESRYTYDGRDEGRRWSGRSVTSRGSTTRPATTERGGSSRGRRASGTQAGHEYTMPAFYDNLNEVGAPAPVQSPRERRPSTFEEGRSRGRSIPGSSGGDEYTLPTGYDNLNEVAIASPIENTRDRSYSHTFLEEERSQSRSSRDPYSRRSTIQPSPMTLPMTPITALPPIQDTEHEGQAENSSDEYIASKSPKFQRASSFATQLYTVSYLIIFSILGTLARLGLQWLTFYPGAPVLFSELWANFAGTLFMGFLAEDRCLFRDEWGELSGRASDEEKPLERVDTRTMKTAHAKIKKTIPLYIGLATGFCGSFTSFSSFIRDTFLALANDMPNPSFHPVQRNGGYSVMAVFAVIIITTTLCTCALKTGAHIAIFLDGFTPTLPFRLLRKFLDRVTVIVAFGAWIGAIIMIVWPPDRPGGPQSKGTWANETWRGQAIFACAFAPVGCLLRFYVSLKLNGLIPSFPLGTFTVNIFGTAVLAMAYDLQHVRLTDGVPAGGRLTCQALQGVMDGFCGALTTVSTWVAEYSALRRGHGWMYAGTSVAVGLGVLTAIMGSVRWTMGWEAVACF